MTHQERDRLAISLVVALAIHVVVGVGLELAEWGISDYPEATAVFVDLLEYTSAPPVAEEEPADPGEPPEPEPRPNDPPPEPVPEPPEPEPVQPPEPEPAPEPPVVEQPDDAPEPEPPEPPPVRTTPEPQDTPPAPEPTPEIEPEPVSQPETRVAAADPEPEISPVEVEPQETPVEPEPRDAPAGSFDQSDLVWLQTPSTDRVAQRTPDAELFADTEAAETGELPAWIAEGTIQPLETLAPADRVALEQRTEAVPGLDSKLDEILARLNSASRQDQPATAEPGSRTESSGADIPGDISWIGGGMRRPVGTLMLPVLTSDDFGPLVPARIQFVIVFDVNADGRVIPGSLILRQSSGYTLADQKVRRAISTWQFEPAPGADDVTAICTIIIERDEVR